MSALLVPLMPMPDPQALASLAVLSLASPSSRRNYSRSIRLFLGSGRALTREGVQAYLGILQAQGNGPATRNVALAAIRLLAREAYLRGGLSDLGMAAIERIKGARVQGSKIGNWLDLAGVKAMLRAASAREQGVRDVALLALLIGCGLRRAEVCALDWSQWQRREGRWVVADLTGKGGKVRTVPCPRWAAEYVNEWKDAWEEARHAG